MADAIIEAELVAACSSLGYSDGKKYVRDPDCIETIRDLLRYLKRDDSSHQIRLALGKTSVVQTDLIPLLREHSSDKVLLDLLLRLLVNLTSPALLIFNQEVPVERAAHQQYLSLVAQQQAFKEAFTDGGVWASVGAILGDGLQQEGSRDDNTNLIVEMCLVMLRNVLAVIPGRQDSIRTQDDADLHDQVLWSLHLAGVPDLLLYLATCQHEQELSLHTLEIVSLILRQQDPQNLATSAVNRSKEEKKKDDSELQRIREAEKLRNQQKTRKHFSSRHSRFGGTYYIQNMKSISDRDIISHRPVVDVNTINFDKDKKGKKIPKNRAPLADTNTTRRSTLAIRLFLQEFCIEFLNGAYNNIMYIVKDNLNRARTQEHDESYYLWAMKFFMEFNRHHEFKVELVSETLSIQTVHYVQTNIENYYEMMTTEKKKIPLWSRRMHNGLRAYQEILLTLASMDKSVDPSVRSSSLTLKSKVFYVLEYRELPLILLQNYDLCKMSRGYLKDLVEMTHIFLKLLEGMFKSNKHLMVQQNAKRKQAKKKPMKKTKPQEMTIEKLELLWSSMADELSSLIEDPGTLPEVVPFDALSEEAEEDQKGNAMRKVNALLRKKEMPEALALYRASREVWPEGDIFGKENIEVAEEFACLREIFMTDLNPVVEKIESEEEDDEEDIQAEEMELETVTRISEKELDFMTFVRRFANTKIMQAYGILLKGYATNSALTNRCVVKMFHRIAWDSKLAAIFFQSSLFITFNEILNDPARKTNSSIDEIVKFAKYIIRQFFKVAETNPKVFMEILFWKNNKDAVDIECGYDNPNSNDKIAKVMWTEEEDNEVTQLFEEYKSKESEEEEKDVADFIVENLIRQDRTRRMVIRKLKDLALITNTNEIKKKSVKTKGREWTEIEEEELRVLFEEHKGAIDPLARIMDFMINPKSKNRIVEKLLSLNIISDKSEVKKKKVPKATKSKRDNNDDENSSSSSEEDEAQNSQATVQKSQSKVQKSQQLPAVTPYLVSAALRKVLEAKMETCVQWLADTLTEVAEDRETDGDFQAIPILAFTEEQTSAMEDPNFQSLMKIIGFQTPQTHEEMFWRVPSKLTVEGLRKRAQYLIQGLAGTLPDVPESKSQALVEKNLPRNNVADNDTPSKSPKIKSKKVNKKSAKSKNLDFDALVRTMNEEDSSDKENNLEISSDDEPLGSSVPSSLSKKKLSHQKSKVVDSDSEDEPLAQSLSKKKSIQENEVIDSDSENEPLAKSQSKKESTQEKSRVFDSDSEDEQLSRSVPSSLSKNRKRSLQSSEGQDSVSKKRRVVMDDSDDEGPLPSLDTEDLLARLEDSEPLSKSRIVESDEDSSDAANEDSVPLVRSRIRAIVESDDE